MPKDDASVKPGDTHFGQRGAAPPLPAPPRTVGREGNETGSSPGRTEVVGMASRELGKEGTKWYGAYVSRFKTIDLFLPARADVVETVVAQA